MLESIKVPFPNVLFHSGAAVNNIFLQYFVLIFRLSVGSYKGRVGRRDGWAKEITPLGPSLCPSLFRAAVKNVLL